jgi:hypothetical protein
MFGMLTVPVLRRIYLVTPASVATNMAQEVMFSA